MISAGGLFAVSVFRKSLKNFVLVFPVLRKKSGYFLFVCACVFIFFGDYLMIVSHEKEFLA